MRRPSAGEYEVVREQDRYLPVANVARIMQRVLPEEAMVAKEGKEAVKLAVSEFISFVTSEASDRCKKEKRKTVSGEDLICAIGTLGMDHYVEPLKAYLKLYKDSAHTEGAVNRAEERRSGKLVETEEKRADREAKEAEMKLAAGRVLKRLTTGPPNKGSKKARYHYAPAAAAAGPLVTAAAAGPLATAAPTTGAVPFARSLATAAPTTGAVPFAYAYRPSIDGRSMGKYADVVIDNTVPLSPIEIAAAEAVRNAIELYATHVARTRAAAGGAR